MSKMDPREPLLPKVGDDWIKPKEREPLLPKRDPFVNTTIVNTTRGTWQLPDVVRWTDVPPNKMGWYWWRRAPLEIAEVVAVRPTGQVLLAGCSEIFYVTRNRFGGEWWPTPIEPPKEATG